MSNNNYLQRASEAIGYVIETIKNKETGYKVRAIINGAFHNLKKDLDSRPTKKDIDKLKTPYFKTLAELKAARPDATPGDKAWIGDPYPGTVWNYTNANKWEDTKKAPPAEEVNLEKYARIEQIDTYNVTTQIPLKEGYYTPESARLAVPESIRKAGLVITYQTSLGVWVTEKFESKSPSQWDYDDFWRSNQPIINKLPEWLDRYNIQAKKNTLEIFKYPFIAIKDIWFEYEEKPTWWDERIPMLRNVGNDRWGSGAMVTLNFHDPIDTNWESVAAWDDKFNLVVKLKKTPISELRTYEAEVDIDNQRIKAHIIVDGSFLNESPIEHGLVLSSGNGWIMQAEIRKKNYSIYVPTKEWEGEGENETNTDYDPITMLDEANLRKAVFQPRYIDILPYCCSSNVPLNKIGLYVPSSTTATTIELSNIDALDFDRGNMPLVLKFSETDYKVAYFSEAIDNTLTLLYSYEEIDLTKVINFMALHDTIRGRQGQHLSPWGYRAMAQYIVKHVNDTSCLADNLLKSYVTERCQVSVDYEDKRIVDLDGNLLCEPIVNNLWKTGGNTGIVGKETGATIANSCGVSKSGNNRLGFNWNTQAYNIVQATADAYVDFPINARFAFKGFLKVGVVNPIEGDFDGKAKMIVFADKKEIYNEYISPFMGNVIIKLQDKFYKNLIVRFIITESKNTKVTFNYIALYREYTNKLHSITPDSVVAVLGSSNTQYPMTQSDYIEIIEGDQDNQVGSRPDGTNLEGYCYYPKQLARLTGAKVDNWGKNGQRTSWGLEQMNKIFATKQYSHIIFTLFGNDINAGVPYEEIMDNILKMCNYAISKGCRPYVVMSYGTAASSQTYKYGRLHDMMIEGVY